MSDVAVLRATWTLAHLRMAQSLPDWDGIQVDDGIWHVRIPSDPRARGLLNRHYSARHYADGRRPLKCLGPGEYLLLLTQDAQAVFGWIHNTVERFDHQTGIYCPIFRNEGPLLSSSLVLFAEEFARWRWPEESRLFTYIDPGKIASTNPGYCFKKAGWLQQGVSASGKLILLTKEGYGSGQDRAASQRGLRCVRPTGLSLP